MPTLLIVQASAAADRSLTRQVAAALVTEVATAVPGLTVVERDLAAMPLPGLTTGAIAGMFRPPADRTPAERSALTLSDLLIGELEAADAIVLASPMYNYTVSAQLKGWVDQVVMPGRTFDYGPAGRSVGALNGRPVVLVTASGGSYGEGRAHEDFHTPYLRHVLGFIGLHDLTVVRAEGAVASADAALAAGLAAMPAAAATLAGALLRPVAA